MRSWIMILLVMICALTVNVVEGSTFHFDDQSTGNFSDIGPGTGELVYKVHLTGFVDSSPVEWDGSVYLTNSPGMSPSEESLGLYAVNATNGSIEWKVSGVYGMATPAVSNHGLFVHSYDNKTGNGILASVYASNGTERWNVTLEENVGWWKVSSSPLIHNDRVYVLSYGGDLHCFDLQGNELWNVSSGGVNENYFSSPSATDEWVVYPQNDSGDYLTAVNETGSIVWKRPVNGNVINTPVISDGNVYIATESRLYGFEVGGSELWNISFSGGMSTPAIAHDRLFVGSEDGKLYCFNTTNGEKIWNFTAIEDPEPFDSIKSSPAYSYSNGIVYFASNEANGTVFALNASDGDLVWKYDLGTYVMSSPFIYENKLFIGADDGNMYIFGLWKDEITLTPGNFTAIADGGDNFTVSNFTALGALQRASELSSFNYTVNNSYGGEDLYPTSIGGFDEGYWCYEVNGVEPMKGINKYNVSDGDTVRYWLWTSSSDSAYNTPNSVIIEVNSKTAYINDMTVTNASRGGNATAWVNVTAFSNGWYVVVVSGTNDGESVAGTSTFRLTTGQNLRLPVIVSIPQQVEKGDYDLYAGVYNLNNYPNNILNWYGHQTCEVK